MFSVGVRLSARRLAAAPRLANASAILRAARPSVSTLSLLRSSFRPFSSQSALEGEAPQYRETEQRDKVAGVGKRVVFLGSLPYRSTIDDVHEHVKDYKPTKIRLGADQTGRPLGWAMVEFATEDDAATFISTYEEEALLIGDRVVRVAWASVPTLSAPAPKPALSPPSKSVFVGNLLDATRAELLELAQKFGPVRRVRLRNNMSNSVRNYAHIDFENLIDAEAMVAMKGLYIRDQPLRLDFAVGKEAPEFPPNHKLYFSDYHGPEEELKQALKPYLRKVLTVYFLRDPQTKENTGNGFIDFVSTEDATKAKNELNGSATPGGHKLWVAYSSSNPNRQTYKDKVLTRGEKREWAA